jgi:alkylation response protein AidB-like acyl-CoA dehydrogenase
MLEGLRKINAGGFSRIPTKYGGNGLSFKDMMIMTIEIMKHDGSFGIFMGVQEALGNSTIYETGNEEQKERFLT